MMKQPSAAAGLLLAAAASSLLLGGATAEIAYRQRVFAPGTGAPANASCSVLPPRTCWSNPTGKIASHAGVGADPGACCDLCRTNAGCATWNHGSHDPTTGTWTCDLYRDAGPNKTSDDGCSGGFAAPAPAPPPRGDRPNIVFLVVESTDGRTWQRGYSDDLIPMPALRELQEGGVAFHRHYANAPVCCPSRATFWSGRHAHKIPHHSAVPGGPNVTGAWNNYEGLPPNFDQRIDQVLADNGYNTLIVGKEDWTAGGHSENVYLNSWTMYTQFPYDINATGGWGDETGDCASNGTVKPGGGPRGTGSAHGGDWATVWKGTDFIAKAAQDPDVPFFIYQGMNIVHPPYATNEYWYNMIDPGKVTVPPWLPLEDMHPCDFQSSMLKMCTPSDAEAAAFYSEARRRNVRRIYAAEVAEFSEMVGMYMEAVKNASVWNQTVFIVTSDHGDMQMEHQQHYKMVPRDPSASVPMVIFDGRPGRTLPAPRVVMTPTQLIDIFPTIMDYATVPAAARPADLDGSSLVPMMAPAWQQQQPQQQQHHHHRAAAAVVARSGDDADGDVHPDFVTSQFHGCNIAMSWFLIVQSVGNRTYKLINWGSGSEVPSQLFDLTADPSEFVNLLNGSTTTPAVEALRAQLDGNLRATIDYPMVAQQVAQYNKDSFAAWTNITKDWKAAIHAGGLRWEDSWDYDPAGAIAAVEKWMAEPATILPCRHTLKWPAAAASASSAQQLL